jgi:acetyl-CoA acetyltransferase
VSASPASGRSPVIVGVAESDLGITAKTIPQLQVQGALAALADAGLSVGDVDGLFTNGAGRFPANQLAEQLGIQPTWTDSTFAGGSTWVAFVAHASEAIRSGRCEVAVIAYGSNQRSAKSRRLGGAEDADNPGTQFETPYGPLLPASAYALAAARHMHEFGTTREALAEVAVAAREWALRNPKAFRYGDGPLTVDDVLASPELSTPLHVLDCCLVTDGGGAVVLTSAERAADLPGPPVAVLGHGEIATHMNISQMPDLTASGGRESAARAFAMAGVGVADVDVAQLYDSFTITVLLTLEALGFCGRGEAGDFVADGRLRPGGAFPMNTSGGGLSYCHPGQLGILLVIEAVRQLRGQAGERQVDGAEIAVCHGTGGFLSHHATTVLGVQR